MIASAGSRAGRVPVLAKYDVLEELGHGGMATVYRAHDKRLARDVAVKVLHPHLRENGEIAHRFAVEAKAVAKLRHPNIVEVFDVSSEQENEQYLVVELVRGPTLRKLLADRGVMPPEVGAALVLELLAGVAHAHASGVVHRDVKPENVLIEHRASRAPASARDPMPSSSSAPSGDRLSVKLTDFGIAKLLDAQGVTSTGQVLGSPAHMAPEQIEGGEVDGRADVFGLGVLFYECIVGHLPFQGNNPAQVLRRVLDGVYAPAERERPIVGKRWSQILDLALARNADDRYADAGAMRDAIAGELARLEIAAPRSLLEGWLENPASGDDTALVDRLVQLGHAARKRGDAVSAAADFNRALAYTPNDPTLLRIVSTMHRSEARARILRRTAPLVLGAIVLGTSAYAVARAFKAPAPTLTSPSASTTASVAPSSAPTSTNEVAIVTPKASATTSASGRTVATPTVVPPVKPVMRTFRFAKLKPNFGVHMTIDGAVAANPEAQGSFTLDEKPHTLVFTCASDLCLPQTINVPAGEKDDALQVELAIAPARLLVEGDSSHSYGIEELPGITLAAGQEAEIPMSAGDRPVSVFDRNDPSKRQLVRLIAGKSQTVSFRR
jgi:eukaryotic-like serine/threonine-protein kinase